MTTPRYSTRRLLLDYFKYDSEPRYTSRAIDYMVVMHKCTRASVRLMLYRLVRDGKIKRVDGDWYQIVAGA